MRHTYQHRTRIPAWAHTDSHTLLQQRHDTADSTAHQYQQQWWLITLLTAASRWTTTASITTSRQIRVAPSLSNSAAAQLLCQHHLKRVVTVSVTCRIVELGVKLWFPHVYKTVRFDWHLMKLVNTSRARQKRDSDFISNLNMKSATLWPKLFIQRIWYSYSVHMIFHELLWSSHGFRWNSWFHNHNPHATQKSVGIGNPDICNFISDLL